MAWYLIMLGIFLVMGIYIYIIRKKTGYDSSMLILFTSCFILFIFAALRSVNVGADTSQYQFIFDWVKTLKFSEIATTSSYIAYWDAEYSYKIYNKLLSFISSHNQTITVMNSLLLIGFIGLLIKRQSQDKWLSIFLYLTLGFYQTALNLTPSSISAALAMVAIPYALKKKLLPYFVLIAIASIFHTSAVIFLPLYFILRIKLTQKRILIFLFIGFILSRFYLKLRSFIILLLPSSYQMYLLTDQQNGITSQLLVWIMHLILIMICWFAAWKAKRIKEFIYDNNIGFHMFLIESIMYFFALESKMFSRVAFLFSVYLIISIPKMLRYSIKKDIQVKINTFYNKRLMMKRATSYYYYVVIVLFCIFQYVLRLKVNNIGTTMPYEFFFN